MGWIFQSYGRSLKHSKDPLPPRDIMSKFGLRNVANELEKNIKLQFFPIDLQNKVEGVVINYWYFNF